MADIKSRWRCVPHPLSQISEWRKNELAAANRRIDGYFACKEKASPKVDSLIKLMGNPMHNAEISELRQNSIKKLAILHAPFVCNFNCPDHCYTSESSLISDGLNSQQLIKVIKQARQMGAEYTYWAGKGEVTLMKSFWEVMEWQAENRMPAIVFTNGSVFADDRLCRKTFRMNSGEFAKMATAKYPQIHFYVKFWHSKQEKAAEMVGVKPHEYPYCDSIDGMHIASFPKAFTQLIEAINSNQMDRKLSFAESSGRIGFQVTVSKKNYGDFFDNMLPSLEKLENRLAFVPVFVEPVIFSGNAAGKNTELQLTPQQYESLLPYLAEGGDFCQQRQSTDLILSGTKLTPGIAIPPRDEDSVIDKKGKIKDIFQIFHNEYFRKVRKIAEELNGCLCRAVLDGKISLPQL